MKQRAQMVEIANTKISIRRQCTLLGISRSNLYYNPVGEKQENLKMMAIIDQHLIDHPTEGVMSIVYYLRDKGFKVGPKRIRRLFNLMGRTTLYRKKNLSKTGQTVYIKPYLLRHLNIDSPNQVWCTDITYIPMKKGFMYLTAFIDVYSRKIMSFGISNTMSTKWCIEVMEEGIRQYGKPQIINSDQGTQYTSSLWNEYLANEGIQISMDGKGRATDNAWIERFWKTLKTEHIYLSPSDNGLELLRGVQNHIAYYHEKIHHTTKQKPNDRYHQISSKQVA
ncbi:MAG: IS3 family transposase [Saprospiraceae bacterium]|nr:IS3 family transposase [Saprospiraceae bacterium]